MDRKEKVFVIKNISHLKENLMFLSKSKENVILLDCCVLFWISAELFVSFEYSGY